MMHCGEVIKLEAGVLDTDDEKLIKSLNGSKGAKLIGEAPRQLSTKDHHRAKRGR